MSPTIHEPESAILIQGPDAKKFLQGQITLNLDTLESCRPALAAHCQPQGRVIGLFKIVLHQHDYYLIMPEAMLTITLSALKKYSVFYQLTLQPVAKFPFEYSPPDKIERIRSGIPAVYPETSGLFLPHEINLPALGAVSFDKGCFTGQEIIARMHYRGKLKKHLYLAAITVSSPPEPGQEVFLHSITPGAPHGVIVDSVMEKVDNCLILLVCNDDNAKNGSLMMDAETKTDVTFIALPEVT